MGNEIVMMSLEEVLELPVYPAADIFPMLWNGAEPPRGAMSSLTLSAFADQLLDDGGVKEPLIVWRGQLVDGRNRRAAAALAGIEFVPVREEVFADEDEADRFIVALNVARRQMSKSQTAAVAALYWPLYEGRVGRPRNGGNSSTISNANGKTRNILGRMFHVNEKYVEAARKLWLNDLDDFNQLHQGRKSFSDVEKSPGQKVKPDESEELRARKAATNANAALIGKIKALAKLDNDSLSYAEMLEEKLKHAIDAAYGRER